MDLERVKELSEGVKASWAAVQVSASTCFGFWAVQNTLPKLVQMENGRLKHVDFHTELLQVGKYAKKAKKKAIKDIREGIEICNSYAREAPNPGVLFASGFFIRALQICKEQNDCSDIERCPLLAYMETICLEI